jgi:hypothetical protein
VVEALVLPTVVCGLRVVSREESVRLDACEILSATTDSNSFPSVARSEIGLQALPSLPVPEPEST